MCGVIRTDDRADNKEELTTFLDLARELENRQADVAIKAGKCAPPIQADSATQADSN